MKPLPIGNEDTSKALRLASYNISNSDPAPTDLWENDSHTTESIRNEFRYLAGAAEEYFGQVPGVKDMAAIMIVATSSIITLCEGYTKVELDRNGVFTLMQATGAIQTCKFDYIPNLIRKDCKFLPNISNYLWLELVDNLFKNNNLLLKLRTMPSATDTLLFSL